MQHLNDGRLYELVEEVTLLLLLCLRVTLWGVRVAVVVVVDFGERTVDRPIQECVVPHSQKPATAMCL